jgi:hypothetical protein
VNPSATRELLWLGVVSRVTPVVEQRSDLEWRQVEQNAEQGDEMRLCASTLP